MDLHGAHGIILGESLTHSPTKHTEVHKGVADVGHSYLGAGGAGSTCTLAGIVPPAQLDPFTPK